MISWFYELLYLSWAVLRLGQQGCVRSFGTEGRAGRAIRWNGVGRDGRRLSSSLLSHQRSVFFPIGFYMRSLRMQVGR